MTDRAHTCYLGVNVDHLYEHCPALRRRPGPPVIARTMIDPLGSDVCRWCVRVWRARHPDLLDEAAS